jgi:hypothetical protein
MAMTAWQWPLTFFLTKDKGSQHEMACSLKLQSSEWHYHHLATKPG